MENSLENQFYLLNFGDIVRFSKSINKKIFGHPTNFQWFNGIHMESHVILKFHQLNPSGTLIMYERAWKLTEKNIEIK